MLKKIGAFLIKRRTTITLVIFTVLILEELREKKVPYNLFDLKGIWGPVGMLIVLAGVSLRSWAAGVLHKTETLAQQGPYALIRHPLYTGSLFIALGFCIISGDIRNIIAALALTLLIYVPKKVYEEKKLAKEFGPQWTAYTAKVPAFIPYKIPSFSAVGSGFSLSQWRHNREYEAALVCLGGLILMQFFHMLLSNRA